MLYPEIFAPPFKAARYKASSKALFFDRRGVFSSITDLPVTSTNLTSALTIIGKSKNGLIRVSYDSFITKEEALIELETLKSQKKSSWILSL